MGLISILSARLLLTSSGVDTELITLLVESSPLPVTYAGGVRTLEDCASIARLGRGAMGFTVGSALALFGGELDLDAVAAVTAEPKVAPSALVPLSPPVEVAFLDYGGGNIRSLRNAIRRCGGVPVDVESPEDLRRAQRVIFPGVGRFGTGQRDNVLCHCEGVLLCFYCVCVVLCLVLCCVLLCCVVFYCCVVLCCVVFVCCVCVLYCIVLC